MILSITWSMLVNHKIIWHDSKFFLLRPAIPGKFWQRWATVPPQPVCTHWMWEHQNSQCCMERKEGGGRKGKKKREEKRKMNWVGKSSIDRIRYWVLTSVPELAASIDYSLHFVRVGLYGSYSTSLIDLYSLGIDCQPEVFRKSLIFVYMLNLKECAAKCRTFCQKLHVLLLCLGGCNTLWDEGQRREREKEVSWGDRGRQKEITM